MKHLFFWRGLWVGALLLPLAGCVTEERPAKPVGRSTWGRPTVVKTSSLNAKPGPIKKIKNLFTPKQAAPSAKFVPPRDPLVPQPGNYSLPGQQGSMADSGPQQAPDPRQIQGLQEMLNGPYQQVDPQQQYQGPQQVQAPIQYQQGPQQIQAPIQYQQGPQEIQAPIQYQQGPQEIQAPIQYQQGPREIQVPPQYQQGPQEIQAPIQYQQGPQQVQAPAQDQPPAESAPPAFQMRVRRAQPLKDTPPVNVPWRTNTEDAPAAKPAPASPPAQ